MKFILKSDKFRKLRGGYSRVIDISCFICDNHLFYYQKDGPGILKRTYFDRIINFKHSGKSNLVCSKCKEIIGIPIIYKKEKRPAFRLFEGSVKKRIIRMDRVRLKIT